MLVHSPETFFDQEGYGVALFGMSGVGKTRIANILRATGEWYHYSVD